MYSLALWNYGYTVIRCQKKENGWSWNPRSPPNSLNLACCVQIYTPRKAYTVLILFLSRPNHLKTQRELKVFCYHDKRAMVLVELNTAPLWLQILTTYWCTAQVGISIIVLIERDVVQLNFNVSLSQTQTELKPVSDRLITVPPVSRTIFITNFHIWCKHKKWVTRNDTMRYFVIPKHIL